MATKLELLLLEQSKKNSVEKHSKNLAKAYTKYGPKKGINGYDFDGVITAGLIPRPEDVIITGRTMALPLQEIADTISVVQDERHAFRLGVKAQKGIEF